MNPGPRPVQVTRRPCAHGLHPLHCTAKECQSAPPNRAARRADVKRSKRTPSAVVRAALAASVLALGCASGPFQIAVGIARAICRALPPETSAAAPGHRTPTAVEVAPDGGVRLVYGPGAP